LRHSFPEFFSYKGFQGFIEAHEMITFTSWEKGYEEEQRRFIAGGPATGISNKKQFPIQ